MTLTQFLLFFGSAAGGAVLVKLLGMLEEAWKRRASGRERARAAEIMNSVEGRKLTLDEVSLVIRSQQEEIKRLNEEVTSLHAELRELGEERENLKREMATERESLKREQDAKYKVVEDAYRSLQGKLTAALRRLVAVEKGQANG